MGRPAIGCFRVLHPNSCSRLSAFRKLPLELSVRCVWSYLPLCSRFVFPDLPPPHFSFPFFPFPLFPLVGRFSPFSFFSFLACFSVPACASCYWGWFCPKWDTDRLWSVWLFLHRFVFVGQAQAGVFFGIFHPVNAHGIAHSLHTSPTFLCVNVCLSLFPLKLFLSASAVLSASCFLVAWNAAWCEICVVCKVRVFAQLWVVVLALAILRFFGPPVLVSWFVTLVPSARFGNTCEIAAPAPSSLIRICTPLTCPPLLYSVWIFQHAAMMRKVYLSGFWSCPSGPGFWSCLLPGMRRAVDLFLGGDCKENVLWFLAWADGCVSFY